jgi:hypothetical protein
VQNANEPQPAPPFMLVFKLTEGYVLDYGSYTVALTNPVDLAKRVQAVAEQSEVGFQMQGQVPPKDLRPGLDYPAPGPTPELIEATAVPTVVPTATLEGEWENVRKMMAFMAAGFDATGRMFTRSDWDGALPIFAPHVDPKEAEYELSEFLGSLHDDDD